MKSPSKRTAGKARAPRSNEARKPARIARGQSSPMLYPFAAIVGQEEMKLALVLNVVDPNIGGVLIMGHRGTGKSTAVRALADLLPAIPRVKGCLYGCDPRQPGEFCDGCRGRAKRAKKLPAVNQPVRVVDLPLGSTEESVCGSLDIERALGEGRKVFEPGLLARANRGFLYIDEVNLLEDHLVDLLLDVSASGRNLVEREGFSISHPARFVLVGSGNPEEGELRPQLLDRFGLNPVIRTTSDISGRVRIVELREQFDRDPASFFAAFRSAQNELARRITRARETLANVELKRAVLEHIAALCASLGIDGHRGELTAARAGRALAALEARNQVSLDDVRRVATMSLRHRLRHDPLDPADSGERIKQEMSKVFPPSA